MNEFLKIHAEGVDFKCKFCDQYMGISTGSDISKLGNNKFKFFIREISFQTIILPNLISFQTIILPNLVVTVSSKNFD